MNNEPVRVCQIIFKFLIISCAYQTDRELPHSWALALNRAVLSVGWAKLRELDQQFGPKSFICSQNPQWPMGSLKSAHAIGRLMKASWILSISGLDHALKRRKRRRWHRVGDISDITDMEKNKRNHLLISLCTDGLTCMLEVEIRIKEFFSIQFNKLIFIFKICYF